MSMKSSASVSARMLKQLDQRLVGASNEIRAVRELIVKVAHSDATVLIKVNPALVKRSWLSLCTTFLAGLKNPL